jgi:signal transduction histidine kinase
VLDELRGGRPASASRVGSGALGWFWATGWWYLVLLVAASAAAASVWVTLDAGFLAYPGWLAVQKADLILGPVLVGSYWVRVRPKSRFGRLLIVVGLLNSGYIAESIATSAVFTVGLYWEAVIYFGTLLLILAFPSGRLGWFPEGVLLAVALVSLGLTVAMVLLSPEVPPGGAISACRAVCPGNALVIASRPDLVLRLGDASKWVTMVLALGTSALLVWRFVAGTSPQRRALAVGTPIALVFLLTQAAYTAARIYPPPNTTFFKYMRWWFVIARSSLWYGFLAALIVAQLFAGRALQRLIRQSLRRPSERQLESMLREPLGDPSLQLRFWDAKAGGWDGPVEPKAGSALSVVEHDGEPIVALIHDAQLSDDPELLQAAGSVALLAAENSKLDDAWNEALEDVRLSRTRIVQAVDRERQRIALHLHDGTQQRLTTIRLKLATAGRVASEPPVKSRLASLGDNVEAAIEELRQVSQELYPRQLIERGVVPALQTAVAPLIIRHNRIGRHSLEVEAAVYYCCLEAVQNATKHAGPDATINISVHEDAGGSLSFEVSDDGAGFDPLDAHEGMGLQDLRDRVDAAGGRLSIKSVPGHGTVVSGSVPFGGR